jgi:stage V sporulation protein AC
MENAKEKEMAQEYKEMVNKHNPSSNIVKDCVLAFVVGGLICDVGQLFMNMYLSLGVTENDVGYYLAATMVFLGAFLTGIGVYDNIGKYAGAGSIVPITGFANSIVSPAMEFKREGYVFGVGAKMFVIAGPILVYGISSSIIVGLLYYVFKVR